jgi:hypothetical protein
MAAFSLTKGGTTFDFELNGEVKQNDNLIGKWSTSNDDANQVVVTDDSGAMTDINVAWRFNQQNQLELLNGDAVLFNFHSQSGVLPGYRMDGGALVVKPNRAGSFIFPLNGEWKLDEKLDMTVSFGALSSTIDGYVEDDRSRFYYKFFPKAGDVDIFTLAFAGQWSGQIEDGKYIMTFTYKQNDQARIFKLPESVMFDKSINQLVYDYEKHGLKRRLQFVGELKISPKCVITYKLDRQQTGAGKDLVAATTLSIGAKLDIDRFNSKLDMTFALMKADGVTNGVSLIIGGSFERNLTGSKLRLDFRYTFVKTDGVVKTNSFSLAGQFKLKDDDLTLVFAFSNDVATRNMTIMFAADQFRLGDFVGNSQVAVRTENGRVKEIRMLFGLAF